MTEEEGSHKSTVEEEGEGEQQGEEGSRYGKVAFLPRIMSEEYIENTYDNTHNNKTPLWPSVHHVITEP